MNPLLWALLISAPAIGGWIGYWLGVKSTLDSMEKILNEVPLYTERIQ